MNYIVYNGITGKILRTGSCPESMIKFQATSENEIAVEGRADDVCDQIDLKTKKVMKNYITSRLAIEEARKIKDIEEAPAREKEVLIRNEMEQIVRKMAISSLVERGEIEV